MPTVMTCPSVPLSRSCPPASTARISPPKVYGLLSAGERSRYARVEYPLPLVGAAAPCQLLPVSKLEDPNPSLAISGIHGSALTALTTRSMDVLAVLFDRLAVTP